MFIIKSMFIINRFLSGVSSLGTTFNNHEDRIERENSTLLKIAACIPCIGLIINQIESKSLEQKLRALPLPKSLRSDPKLGNILKENATPEEIKTVCKRAIRLKFIGRDYTKAALVNNLLTIAIAVHLLAMNMIPFFVGAIFVSAFSLTALVFTYVLCADRSIKRYEKVAQTH